MFVVSNLIVLSVSCSAAIPMLFVASEQLNYHKCCSYCFGKHDPPCELCCSTHGFCLSLYDEDFVSQTLQHVLLQSRAGQLFTWSSITIGKLPPHHVCPFTIQSYSSYQYYVNRTDPVARLENFRALKFFHPKILQIGG